MKGGEDLLVQRIVVGVDGSATSKAALGWAADLAARLGARLEAVHAWHYPPSLDEWGAVPSNYGFLPALPDREAAEDLARDELADVAEQTLGADPKVSVDQRLIEGRPADVLIEASTGAGLLVLGRSGRSAAAELLLGSVARACTEHSHCPVVVVPAGSD